MMIRCEAVSTSSFEALIVFTFRFFWLYITRDLYLFRMDWDMCAMTL